MIDLTELDSDYLPMENVLTSIQADLKIHDQT